MPTTLAQLFQGIIFLQADLAQLAANLLDGAVQL
jgi:hypothetical protein